MIELRPPDRQCALAGVKSAQRVAEAITTCITADECQVVRLVLVGDAPALVAFTVPNLNVYWAREPQHAEVRLDLIEVEHDPDVMISDQLFEFAAAASKCDRQAAGLKHQISRVRAVDDHQNGALRRQVFQRQPPLLELVEVLRPSREEHCNGRIGQITPATCPICECRTCQPVAHQSGGLASGTDGGSKPSTRVDHAVSDRLESGVRLDGRLGAIATPLRVVGAFFVHPLVGMSTKEIPLRLDQGSR